MKNESMNVCPGCKRHCPACAVKCKYGQKYFEKKACAEKSNPLQKKKARWKKTVSEGSAIYLLISAGRSAKKALKRGETTEARLLASLTDEERQTLAGLLDAFREKNFGPAGD